ncbi:MAG: NTP transferase domain-containing protein [Planctomycetes bacterium]|nr:NTP transferase domain-containing protein [Planctomycetota bacterium]
MAPTGSIEPNSDFSTPNTGRAAAIVLAAGRSRRMRSSLPKVLHPVLGLPLVEYVVRAALQIGAERVIVVASPDHRDQVADALSHVPEVEVVVQKEPLGTAHAILAAKDSLADFQGTGLVLLGDAPAISERSLRALLKAHEERNGAISVLSGVVANPAGYGRVVRGLHGDLEAIIEEKDAPPEVREVREINSGTFAIELPKIWDVLEGVQPSAATGERYATDAIGVARARGMRTIACNAADEADILGVNDRRQLASVTAVLRERILAKHMRDGVTDVDPASTFVDVRATFGADVRLEPFTVIEGPCRIGAGSSIGPFAHLREASLGANVRVGNFVEVVRSTVGDSTRALHLSYIGDAQVGEDVNVGAGTVFANYDGERHQPSTVAAHVSLGANTVVIGPSNIGVSARTGAGAVVKGEVSAQAVVVGVPARPLTSTEGGQS